MSFKNENHRNSLYGESVAFFNLPFKFEFVVASQNMGETDLVAASKSKTLFIVVKRCGTVSSMVTKVSWPVSSLSVTYMCNCINSFNKQTDYRFCCID